MVEKRRKMSKYTQSQPPVSGVYHKGFKGKGMCSWCRHSMFYPQLEYKNTLYCGWYESACKLVSRNCWGIRAIRENNIRVEKKDKK